MNLVQPKRIGMVCRGEERDVAVLKRLIECVDKRAEVILDRETAKKLKRQSQGMRIEDMSADFLICVGGDGTILRTLHYLKTPTPVLGINMGAIGFLAEVQPEDAVSVLTELLEGFTVEKRERLSVELKGERGQMPYAMNEAVIITSKPGKMLHFAIFVDGEELERLRADGVVFATPTGSTAYAMSAGGPIVDPKVDAVIIVPIAPFKLSARPTIVDINGEISLALLGMKEAELVIDGQFYKKMGKEGSISITRGEPAFFVKIEDRYFLKLQDKLRSEG
uniref:NAD kinase n=1 Tax=Candidatus Methanophagaceae archaeon ANME-1 ERB6 TaxID=2759912 RepID=A0A7G9YUE1_9EURY|nr:NAD kinase [Methanosarcinales archaeon ANME-1 ERB6]